MTASDLVPLPNSALFLLASMALAMLTAATEAALFALAPESLRDRSADADRRSRAVRELLLRPRPLESALGANSLLADIGITVSGIVLLRHHLPLPAHWPSAATTALYIALLVSVLLPLCRMLPRALATAAPLRIARYTVNFARLSRWLWSPLTALLRVISAGFAAPRAESGGARMDIDTLEQALDLTTEAGTTPEEKRILRGILQFGDVYVHRVMRPRSQVGSLPAHLTFTELLERIRTIGYSRIPVWEGDRVIGILYSKDLLAHIDASSFNWHTLLRTPWFVPEHKKLADLLREFQERKTHLAVVVDEYGSMSGIVTLEDVIEEIVGEITDEYDDEDLSYSKLDDHTWVFEGRTALSDMYRVLGVDGESFDLAKGDGTTLGGFVVHLAGRIPAKGEHIIFENWVLTIESADEKRVRRVKVQGQE